MQTFSLDIEGITYSWNVETLWEKSNHLPTIDWEIPSNFKDQWNWGEDHLSEHIERCLNADLSFPILIWDGKVVDGCHRIVKTLALGHSVIKAKEFKNIPPPDEDQEKEMNETLKKRFTYNDMVLIIKEILKLTTDCDK